MRSATLLSFAILVPACGGGGSTADDVVTPDAPPAGVDGALGCPRTAGPADGPRSVVVSHPYDAAGGQAPTWEVLDLSATGELTRATPPRTFTMGRATAGAVAFTPDGEVGLVAQEDGTLGVFRLDPGGIPVVVDAGFDGGFYATRVIVDPAGDRAWILDGNWRENGGGIYGVTIGCDGALTATGLLVPSKLPGALAITGTTAVVAAQDVADSALHDDVHLVSWGAAPTAMSGVDAFGDDNAIIGGAALTSDGATFLVGDVSQFSGVANRVAVVHVGSTELAARSVITPVEDPEAIVASPFGDVALVASAFGDALFVLDTGGPAGAWRVRGEVAYVGGSPQLPGDLAMIDRGTLRGHVLVAENVSVRHVAFRQTGAIEDLGSLAFGGGLEQIAGAIGVTP